MTKLHLRPGSKELENILRNRFLFNWYSKMLMEDWELEWGKYEYLGMLTNYDGAIAIKRSREKGSFEKEMMNNMQFKDGVEATKKLKELGIIKEDNQKEDDLEEIE